MQTGLENAESYSMADDALKEGDTVIVTGNVNLAHEEPVKVVENWKMKIESWKDVYKRQASGRLEYALECAATNKGELEKVLEHYKDEPEKYRCV